MPNLTEYFGIISATFGTAIGGGFLVKWIDRRYSLREKVMDSGVAIREELRVDVRDLKEELDKLQQKVEQWQLKYNDLYKMHVELQAEHKILLARFDELNRASQPISIAKK